MSGVYIFLKREKDSCEPPERSGDKKENQTGAYTNSEVG
jgi:hypothetical protein